jgi:hypothetical protein
MTERGSNTTYLPWFGRNLWGLSGFLRRSTVEQMAGGSRLEIGARAPEFTLAAANREGKVSLRELVARGPVILEFLRGTW